MGSLGVTVESCGGGDGCLGDRGWHKGIAQTGAPRGHLRRLGRRMVHTLRLLVLDLSTCREGDRFVLVKTGYFGPGST